MVDVFGRDGVPGIADIDAVRVRSGNVVTAPLRRRWNGRLCGAALPEVGIAMKFDGSRPGSKFTGIVQNIDENLLYLAGFEIKKMIATSEVGGDRNGFIVSEGRNLMQRLLQAFADIAALQIQPPLHVASDAQLEHRGGHAGEPLGAVLHAAQDFPLVLGQWPQRLTKEQPAVSTDGGERSSKIVDGPCEERSAVLSVLPQFQIGLDEAL